MDDTTIQSVAGKALPGPAIADRSHWNAWGCALVCIASFLIFAIAQIVVFLIIFVHQFPDVFRGGMSVEAIGQLKTPAGMAKLLTAPNLFFLSLASYGAFVSATVAAAWLGLGATPHRLGIGIRPHVRQIVNGVLAGIGLLVLSTIVGGIEAKIFGPHPQLIAEVLTQRRGPAPFFLDLASVALLAPIGEELFFRGVLFAGLSQRLPIWVAALVSGLTFGLAHGDLWNLPSLALIGIGLAYVYYRNGTLWSNITSHATVNGITLVLTYVAPQLVK